MKKILFLILILPLLISSCKNSVEKANKIIAEQCDTVIKKDIAFFNSTINFLYYAELSNYWYSGEYTFKDIIQDKYKIGYIGLTRLDNTINSIETDDIEIIGSIEELDKQIKIAQKELQQKQRTLDNSNGFLGMFVSGILSLNSILSSEEEQERIEKKGKAIPENVTIPFESLVKLLFEKYKNVALTIHTFEDKVFEQTKPNYDEKLKIRQNLKQFIINKINQQYISEDTVSRDGMIKILFDFYEKEYQLSTNSISVTESSERSVEQNVVSGISAKISNGNHFQNKDCTSRDNFLKSPDRENMHWRADTTECSSIEINTIKVSTDNEIVDKRINQSIDDSICSLLNGYMGSKYTSISDCLTAVNDTTSGYLSYGCDVNVITNEKDILCLEISDKLWVGGAHDTWFRSIYCNFNLLTGIVLKLNDIVNDKYFEQLNSIAKKLFWKKYSEKVSLGEYTKTKFKLTEASFQIKNEGLLFQFHEGHFSCNADGALNILVPFKDIKELINPSFTFQ